MGAFMNKHQVNMLNAVWTMEDFVNPECKSSPFPGPPNKLLPDFIWDDIVYRGIPKQPMNIQ
jgi:hypothetical protein